MSAQLDLCLDSYLRLFADMSASVLDLWFVVVAVVPRYGWAWVAVITSS